jgi:cytochrome c553
VVMNNENPAPMPAPYGRSLALLTVILVLAGCSPDRPTPSKQNLAWAYATSSESYYEMPKGHGPYHVSGSARAFSLKQVLDDENPVDWFPEGHPTPPFAVAHEPASGVTPCAECHLYNGQGFLGAADVNGLTAPYIIEQVKAFRSGERNSADPARLDTSEMIKVARHIPDADLARAAAYFAALPRRPRLRVIETSDVPVTKADKYGWLDLIPHGGREPIGARVIEVSADMPRMLLGDDHVAFIDYAPPGAVKRGETLVQTGGAGGQPCRSCHGPELRGAGDIPPLAGRSASYLARALWDIKSGARKGSAVAAMQTPVRGLTEQDIVNITAYLASLKP